MNQTTKPSDAETAESDSSATEIAAELEKTPEANGAMSSFKNSNAVIAQEASVQDKEGIEELAFMVYLLLNGGLATLVIDYDKQVFNSPEQTCPSGGTAQATLASQPITPGAPAPETYSDLKVSFTDCDWCFITNGVATFLQSVSRAGNVTTNKYVSRSFGLRNLERDSETGQTLRNYTHDSGYDILSKEIDVAAQSSSPAKQYFYDAGIFTLQSSLRFNAGTAAATNISGGYTAVGNYIRAADN